MACSSATSRQPASIDQAAHPARGQEPWRAGRRSSPPATATSGPPQQVAGGGTARPRRGSSSCRPAGTDRSSPCRRPAAGVDRAQRGVEQAGPALGLVHRGHPEPGQGVDGGEVGAGGAADGPAAHGGARALGPRQQRDVDRRPRRSARPWSGSPGRRRPGRRSGCRGARAGTGARPASAARARRRGSRGRARCGWSTAFSAIFFSGKSGNRATSPCVTITPSRRSSASMPSRIGAVPAPAVQSRTTSTPTPPGELHDAGEGVLGLHVDRGVGAQVTGQGQPRGVPGGAGDDDLGGRPPGWPRPPATGPAGPGPG